MLERLSKHTHFCFLDGYSGFSQIPVSEPDQENTTFTCPFGTYAYRCMPSGLCNAPPTFQKSENIAIMHLWKVAGALHKPKGIRLYA